MRNKYFQPVILLIAGLWFTISPTTSFADQFHIQTKSKALAHYIMAVVHDLNGDTQSAIVEYGKSAKYDAKQPLPHLRLGAYYSRLGRINEAAYQLKEVIKLQPDLSQAHYLLALIYSSQKKYMMAADQYELVLKTAPPSNPDNVAVHAYLGQLYFALGKYPQASLQLNQILEFQPTNVSALYLKGSIDLELNQKDKAKENFRKILEAEPQHDGALNSLAYMYADEGINLDEALKMAQKAVNLDPSNGAYYDTLGWVLFKKGFYSESLMAFEKSRKYITDPIVFEHMGDVYKAQNDLTLARKFWLKSLSLDSKQPNVSLKLEGLNKISARNGSDQYHLAK